MTTEESSPYDMVQFKVYLPRKLREAFKMFVSSKRPEYNHGIISLETQKAIMQYMEKENKAAHTHKNNVLLEAENKPNFHTSKKRVRVPKPEPVPVPDAVVIGNNGNPTGDQKSQSDFSFSDWANRLGIVIIDKHRELDGRCRDPEFRKEKFTEYKNRLIARRNRSINDNVNIKVSERKKDNLEKMREIILFLDNNELLDEEGRAMKEDFKSAVSVVYGKKDHRPINTIIRNLLSDGEIAEVRIGFAIHGKPSGKHDMTHYQIIDKDMLLK